MCVSGGFSAGFVVDCWWILDVYGKCMLGFCWVLEVSHCFAEVSSCLSSC